MKSHSTLVFNQPWLHIIFTIHRLYKTIYFYTNYCQAATRMIIIIFLMYDNELFCARYIYKYDNFYILMVIVTNRMWK